MNKYILISVFILLFKNSKAQILVDTALIKPLLVQHVSALAHDSMYGRYSGTIENINAGIYIAKIFDSLQLAYLTDSGYGQAVYNNSNFLGYNIIANLKGNDSIKKDSFIVISAHYDHVGGYFNGANDNASGTAAMLTLAHFLRKQNNNGYSILFIAFTAEELGMVGSTYFVNKFTKLNKIKQVINLEMLGRNREHESTIHPYIVGQKSHLQVKQFNTVLKKDFKKTYKNYFKFDLYPSQLLDKRSDHYPFNLKNINAITIMVSSPFDDHYHQVTDEISTLDFDMMAQVVQILLHITTHIVK
jgi:Zn-dependent M28 family amino/carboxypeptidase